MTNMLAAIEVAILESNAATYGPSCEMLPRTDEDLCFFNNLLQKLNKNKANDTGK
jgi:hypothetical protein